VYDDIAAPFVPAQQCNLIRVDQHQFAIDRVVAIVNGTDADSAAERRILVKRALRHGAASAGCWPQQPGTAAFIGAEVPWPKARMRAIHSTVRG
jgi:hypothetical protein